MVNKAGDCDTRSGLPVLHSNKVKDNCVLKGRSPQLEGLPERFGHQVCWVHQQNATRKGERILMPGTAVFDHISICEACQKYGITINDFKILKQYSAEVTWTIPYKKLF